MQYAGGQKTGDQDTGGLKLTARLEMTVQSRLGLGMEGQKRETGHKRTEAEGQNMAHEGRTHEDRDHEGVAHEGMTHEDSFHEGRTLIWRAEIFKVLATFPISPYLGHLLLSMGGINVSHVKSDVSRSGKFRYKCFLRENLGRTHCI
jgi:hypothetical protein